MYFYEHTNGEIIQKPDIVVDPIGPAEYFNSPFVKRWWHEPDGLLRSEQRRLSHTLPGKKK